MSLCHANSDLPGFFAPRAAEMFCSSSKQKTQLFEVAENGPVVVRDHTLRCSGQLLVAVGEPSAAEQAFSEIISTQVVTFSVPQMTQIRGKLQLSRDLATSRPIKWRLRDSESESQVCANR